MGALPPGHREQAGRRTFDSKRLAKEHPGLNLEPYWKQEKPFRVFRPYFGIVEEE